ncbi:MAG: adenosylcobinamide-phosphate synthase CbiB [Planctomycetota bacterium]
MDLSGAEALGPAAVLAAALVLDRTVGEPPARLHPVVWMGRIAGLARDRAPVNGAPALVAGAVLAAALPLTAFALGAAALRASVAVPALHFILSTVLLWTTFSVRLLDREVAGLEARLASGDLEASRAHLPRLCSRDPRELDASELAGAGISSLAENTCDSYVAPWLWYALLGVPGALAYRAVNTLDAVVGYRGRLERIGKASARLDDLLNVVPARLSALLMIGAGARSGDAARTAWRVTRRDARKTPSPNGGWPMAAMAGLLGVVLAKPGVYRLGDGGRGPETRDITKARRIGAWTSRLAAALALGAVLLRGRFYLS